MQIIRINVNKNNINLMDIKNIYSDSYNYNRCVFEFDENWNDYNDKIANFILNDKVYSQPIIDNQCSIPIDVLKIGRFSVGIYGNKLSDEKLIERNTTNLITLEVLKGGYFKDSLNISEDDIKIYEIYISKMNKIYLDVKSEHETAINNIDNKEKDAEKDIAKYVQEKIEEYNENASLKKEEINEAVEEVKKTKTDIEEISEEVKVLEQNSKISEINAKASEQNAQNSLNKVLKIETNIINIQEDINVSKAHIDNQKESVDNSVEEVNNAVIEAANQANISKQQAELSSKNANQTSADKTETKAIKDEVSTMKTSVEQTKSDVEQIKADTQAIFDSTVQAKNDTLKAKEDVENSLENERIASDKKYAKAIDTDEIEIIESGEVELDEDGYMKDVEISTSKDITQDTRVGYNKLNLEKYPYSEGQSVLNGSTVALNNGILSIDATNATADVTVKSISIAGANRDVLVPGKYYFGVNTNGYYESNPEKLVQLFRGVVEITENYYLAQWFTTCKAKEKIDKKLLLSDDVSKTEYEQFGVSPTLEFPSALKNIESNIKINNHQLNCLENQMKSQTLNGLNFNINNDKSISVKGTATVRIEPHVWDKKDDNQLILRKGVTYWNLSGRTLFFNVKKNTYLTINNQKSYTPTEDTKIQYSVYFRFEKNETVDEIVYPFLTTEKDGKYEPFNGGLKKIELENQFLGSFKGYKNYIEKNRFKRNLNILNLTGSEKWQAHINSDYLKTPDESLDFFIQVPSDMKTGSIMLCDKFKFLNFDGGYRSNSNIESVSNGGGYRRIYIRIKKARLDSFDTDGLKNFLKELYEKGDPLKILYVTNTEYNEELSAKILDRLNSLKLYNGINQIDINNFKIKFKANRNLENYIDDQIKLNSTEEIKKYDSRYAKALKIQVNDVKKTKIYVENSQVEELKIEGEEITQNKRLGYNLLINKLTSKTVKGVTFDVQEDGSIIANGTPAETIVVNLLTGNEGISDSAGDNEILKIPESIDKMVFSGCPANKQSKAFKLDLWSKTGELIGNNSDFGNGIKIDFSTNANWRKINRARIVIYAFAKLDDTVFRPMLTEGTEQKPYEKYGATPSFEFPAEIEPRHSNIEISNEEESVHINLNAEIYGIKDFKDEIVKNKLIKYIKKLELTGTEEILKSSRDNLFYIQLDNIVTTANVNIKSGLVLSNCLKNESYTDLRNYTKDYGIEVYLNRIYFRILDFNTVEEVKNKLKELYDSNNSVKIYYILSDPETFELTEEQKQQLDKFKLFDGANNILIENGRLSFKYNKSISKVLSEKDDRINDLQNQIDEIKALLNTTNTASFLAENLAIDNESEVI